MHGFVYIVSNPLYDGLLKIGKSTRTPEIREIELSAHEGVPEKMKLEYFVFFEGNPTDYENKAHEALRRFRYRKEWFRVELPVAISALREVCSNVAKYEKIFNQRCEREIDSAAKEVARNKWIQSKKIIYEEKYLKEDKKIFCDIVDRYRVEVISHAESKVNESLSGNGNGNRSRSIKGGMFKRIFSLDQSVKTNYLPEVARVLGEDIELLSILPNKYKPRLSFDEYIEVEKNNREVIYSKKADVANIALSSGYKFTRWLEATFFLDSGRR